MLSRSQVTQPLNNQVSSEHGTIDANNDDRQRASISYRLKNHPMCQGCTDMLLDSLGKQLSDASKERDSAIKTLKEIESERDTLKKELAALEEGARELDKLEESYWQEFNDFHIQLQTFQNERDSVNLKYDHDARLFEKLQRTNVYNDTFCISHDGHFGTINGFILGRLPEVTLSINPVGFFSKTEHIDGEKKNTYELLFLNRRFDHAMVAFLNCLQQLGDYAERQENNFKLPYRLCADDKFIYVDKIGDASIRLQFGQFKTWTKALKYTLTDTKWILAYALSTSHDWG
ncbi:autophagy protein Apg6-domain-containing protein, partial [Gigaspora rosea]